MGCKEAASQMLVEGVKGVDAERRDDYGTAP